MGGIEMFNNLVESDLHLKETARRSWFFLATLCAYTVLFMIGGVASIYAYDAHLEEQTNEYVVTFVPPVQTDERQPVQRNQQARQTVNSDARLHESVRTTLIRQIADSTVAPDKPSATPSNVPELPDGNVRLGDININAGSSGNPNASKGGGSGGADTGGNRTVVVNVPDTPPPPRVVPSPPPRKSIVSGGVLNGQAIDLPKPVYPQPAKIVKASGNVTVQVLIDETGKVVSAQAVSGHPLLRAAAVQAAYRARFSPTLLSRQPVKVSGVITYNFTL
jgi:TonB family protein